jgi:protein-S-isoprenylcysteine O-methyltransferase Ste14
VTDRPSVLRWAGEAVVAGILLGAAARLAMRGLAWLAGSPGGFSRGGSIEIVVFGALLGAPIALAVFAIRQWRRWEHPWVGVWVAVALYLASVARPSPSAQSALAASPVPGWQIFLVFGLVFLAFGVWIDVRWHSATGRLLPLTLRASLAALAMPGMVAGVVPAVIMSNSTASAPPLAALAGWALVVAGLCLLLTCIVGFASEGHGTLAPYDPPGTLVARGPYRFTRNPMYVGVLAILLGLSLANASWSLLGYAAFVAACFCVFVMAVEEPSLEQQFGDSYRRYKADVPRWIGPRGRL